MRKATIFLCALAMSASAEGSCDPDNKTLFSCATALGNRIEVCDSDATILYSFGEPGVEPQQLAEVIPRNLVTETPWRAMGKAESYALKIPFRGAVHVVYWSLDSQGAKPDAGVEILINGELRATMRCEAGQVRNNLGKAVFANSAPH